MIKKSRANNSHLLKVRWFFSPILLALLFAFVENGQGQSTYNLITSTAGLVSGAKYLIVSTGTNGSGYSMGLQNTNNRAQVAITVASSSISTTPATLTTDAKPFEITLGGSTGSWTLYDAVNAGYLYAASSSSNYLKTQSSSTTWTITFSSGQATLTSANESSRNVLEYNSGASIFSCYNSGTEAVVYLYEKASSCTTPTSAAASSITASGATANWSCASCTGSYIVEYGATGFTPGTGASAGGGTVAAVAASTYTYAITGLASGTAYDYYIRQVCTGPVYSSNSTVQTFTTTSSSCNAGQYTFSTGTGVGLLAPALTSIIASGNDDAVSSVIDFSSKFTFTYEGTPYTKFSVNSNGLMRLGNNVVGTDYSNGITTATNQPKIMPLWDDLSTASTGSVSWGVSGTTPNQILVVDFKLYNSSSTSSAYNCRFQVWLYETTNVIEFVYNAGTTPASFSCGIGGATATNYQSVSTGTNTCSASTANDANATWPGSGRSYTFTPCAALSPTLTTAPTSLSGFTYVLGNGPSTSQSYTISGSNLTGSGNITITGSADYEVSSDNITFGSSITFPYGSGTITSQPKTVYVRLKSGLSAGNYNSEVITNAGGGAPTANVGCSGTVTTLTYCTSTGGTSDGITNVTFAGINNTTSGTGGPYTDYTSGTAAAVIQGSTYPITVKVNTGGSYTNYQTVWIDWNQNGSFADAGETYQIGTATNVTNGSSSSCPYSITVPPGATLGSTRMRVQSKYNSYNTSSCETGFDGEVEDYTVVVSSASPHFTISPTTLSGFTYVFGAGPSASQSYTISGTSLTGSGNITISGSTDYQVSSDNITFSGSITYAYAGGIITGQPKTVYVRLKSGLSVGNYNNENISNTGGGASSVNVVCSGSVTSVAYCTNTNTTNTTYYINNFSTTGGTTNITNNNSGFSTNGYGSFLSMTVTQQLNGVVNFSVTGDGISTYGFGIWVDWNQDGDFVDAGEQVFMTTTYVASATGSFTVPAGATLGSTRMRVVTDWLDETPVACPGTAYSECEDYTFVVTSACTPPAAPGAITSNSPQCSGTGVTFTQGTCTSNCNCYWETSATGTDVSNSSSTYTTDITAGTYNVWVRAQDKTTGCWSTAVTASGTVDLPATPGAITSNSPQCSGTGVTFTEGTCPPACTCYWETSATGVSTASPASANLTSATGAGTYNEWVRAEDASGCWSTAVTTSGTVNLGTACSDTPVPDDASTGIATTQTLSWDAVSGATNYDIYFGTSATPPYVTNTSLTSYTPTLAAGTTYYWKIVPKGTCGAAAGCSIWSFATAACSGGLSGTVTVPGTYATLTQAGGLFAAINANGLCGNLIVNITNNITETGAVTLNQWTVGVGYNVTIQPDAAILRTISGTAVTSLTPMINIQADNVTIDGSYSGSGQWLLFRNTNATAANTGPTIQFDNGATNCTLANCYIENNGTASGYGDVVIGKDGTNSVAILGNDIRNATGGTTGQPYQAIYCNNALNLLSVYDNNIYNWSNYGINALNVEDSASITFNSFYQTATSTSSQQIAINVGGSSNGHEISYNYIGGQAANCGTYGTNWTNNSAVQFIGINLTAGALTPTSIQGNIIQNINLTNTTSNSTTATTFNGIEVVSGWVNAGTTSGNIIGDANLSHTNSIQFAGTNEKYASTCFRATLADANSHFDQNIMENITYTGNLDAYIQVMMVNGSIRKNKIYNIGCSNASASPSPCIIGVVCYGGSEFSNNFVSLSGGVASSSAIVYGYYEGASSGGTINFYYNTINIYGSEASTSYSFGVNILTTSTSTYLFKNNIIVNTSTGGGSGLGNDAIYYQASGGTHWVSDYNDLYSSGNIGNWIGSNKTFTTWKTAEGNQDANSANVLPSFNSNTDIHLSSYTLGKYASTGTGINVDIDGDVRNNTQPDMGADEVCLTSIHTSTTIAGSPFCAGATVSVPYTTIGSFTGTFTAQLSDASGNFSSAVTLGTGASPISGTIPTSTVAGTGYRIRVINSAPVVYGSDNTVDLTVNATPSLTTSTSQTDCPNSAISIVLTSSTASTYAWACAGGVTGASSTAGSGSTGPISVTPTVPGTETYTVTPTAITGGCVGAATAINLVVSACVAPPAAPTNQIATLSTVCVGVSSSLTASVAGSTIYWYTGSCGGTLVGSGSPLVVYPSVTTTYYARAYNGSWSATCGSVTVTVNPGIFTTQPVPKTICVGGSTTYSVVCTNSPTYQWQVCTDGSTWNNITAAGSNPTYANWTTATLSVSSVVAANNGWQYRCNATPTSGTCGLTSSGSGALIVNTTSTAPTSLSVSPASVAPGFGSTLTVNGGTLGSASKWQWFTGSCGGTLIATTTNNKLTVFPTNSSSCGNAGSVTYYVRAADCFENGSFQSYTACVSNSVSVTASSPMQGINACSQAIDVTSSFSYNSTEGYKATVVADNTCGTFDYAESNCMYTSSKHNIWFKFTPPANGSYFVYVNGISMTKPVVSLMTTDCSTYDNELYCVGYYQYYSSQSTYASSKYADMSTCNLSKNTTYYIWVDDDGSPGTFALTVQQLPYDDPNTAKPMNSCGDIYNGTTIGATDCNRCNHGSTTSEPWWADVDCNTSSDYPGYTHGSDVPFQVDNESWFDFRISTPGNYNICLTNQGNCFANAGLQIALFTGSTTAPYYNPLTFLKEYGTIHTYLAQGNSWNTGYMTFPANTNLYIMVDGFGGDNCDYSISLSPQTSCSAIAPLPVSLLSFSADCEDNKIQLNWSTASELNNDYFAIEKSADGIYYEKIATVKGAGNSNSIIQYVAYDESPNAATLKGFEPTYYRLKQVDYNGKTTYYGPVSAKCDEHNVFNAYVNENKTIVVDFDAFKDQDYLINLFDYSGKKIMYLEGVSTDGVNEETLNTIGLSKGIYVIELIKKGNEYQTKKLIVN